MTIQPHYVPTRWAKDKITEGDRSFDIDIYDYEARAAVETYEKGKPWTFVGCEAPFNICEYCGKRAVHHDAIIIAVDGTNRGHPSTSHAKAAAAVYVHHDNTEYNDAVVMAANESKTPAYAVLVAARMALKAAVKIKKRNPSPAGFKKLQNRRGFFCEPVHKLTQVVIKTTSASLVHGMTKDVKRWKENGFVSASGKEIGYKECWEEMDKLVQELNDMGVVVDFWRVAKSKNKAATFLAGAAIDGLTVKDAMKTWVEENGRDV